MRKKNSFSIIREIFHRFLVIIGAVGMTLLFFLVLPLMQTLNKPPATDLTLQSVSTAKLEPPPPPPMEEEPDEEPEPEKDPPQLMEEAQPLDLAQLELALNPGFGSGAFSGDFTVNLNTALSNSKEVDALFSLSDLDQRPRVVYQPGPVMSKTLRSKAPGTVYVVFIVDREGRVKNPMVQKASDPLFEEPAVTAVKKWKFEPGKKNGNPVQFRMRVPITFPKG